MFMAALECENLSVEHQNLLSKPLGYSPLYFNILFYIIYYTCYMYYMIVCNTSIHFTILLYIIILLEFHREVMILKYLE